MSKHRSSPPPPRHVPPPRRSSANAAALADAGNVAGCLAPFIADEEDRAFVGRCIATEGPAHHRIASAALLTLLSQALEAAGGPSAPDPADGLPVRFRLPPHLDRDGDEETSYPIRLPRRALDRLAARGSREADMIADALVDGPAHHALANVAMVAMIDALIERLSAKVGG